MRQMHLSRRRFLTVSITVAALAIADESLATDAEITLTADEQAVLEANERFYAAFHSRDMAAMEALWARKAPVAVIHPGWPGVTGREAVLESWRQIMENPASPRIQSVEPKAYVHASTAFVICYEIVPTGLLIATNIFVREDGAWKMVHHQAGPSAPPRPSGEDKRI